MKASRHLRRLLWAAALVPVLAQAGGDDSSAQTESPWRLGIAVGYGERSNPLIQADDVPIIVDVDIAWFGKRAFFDNGDVGFTFHDGETATVSLVGRINSDRLFFTRANTRFVSVTDSGVTTLQQVAVPERDYAVEAGLEVLTDGAWGSLQLAAYQDISGVHNGHELYARFAYGFRAQKWFFEPSVGFSYKSAKRNDYYWGVDVAESVPGLAVYGAGSGIDVEARILASYRLGRHWAVVGVVQVERLAATIGASPLVRDATVSSHYAGLQYRF